MCHTLQEVFLFSCDCLSTAPRQMCQEDSGLQMTYASFQVVKIDMLLHEKCKQQNSMYCNASNCKELFMYIYIFFKAQNISENTFKKVIRAVVTREGNS